MVYCFCESFFAIGGRHDLEILAKNSGDVVKHVHVIFNYHYARATESHRLLFGGSLFNGLLGREFLHRFSNAHCCAVGGRRFAAYIRSLGRVPGQFHLKQRSAPGSVRHRDTAAVQIREILCDREPESGTAEFSRGAGLRLSKSLKDGGAHLRLYARPAVLHREQHTVRTRCFNRTSDPPAHRSELEGVGKQIEQNPIELLRVYFRTECIRRCHHIRQGTLRLQRVEVGRAGPHLSRQIDLRVVHGVPSRIKL